MLYPETRSDQLYLPAANTMSSATPANNEADVQQPASLLRQTLMTQDECFVYKVPPLATASGYRANEWNLAQPLQTCGFQVERRDNDLYLLFTLENHTKLFALSKIADGEHVQRSVEPVLDSSRYFVTKITTQHNRTAQLGFGFRDRDVAIDLLGNLQQFQKSIQRELEAKHMKVAEIPTLKEGDKMHINLPGAAGSRPRKKATTPTGSGSGGGPFLLKKPPPAAGTSSSPTPANPPKVVVNLSEMETPPEPMEVEGDAANEADAGASQEDSEGAVAKSIIYDFDDIVDDGLGEPEAATSATNMDADDDDFGDFQAA
jgi:adaptin ear-binding coat-associated protein 1/2